MRSTIIPRIALLVLFVCTAYAVAVPPAIRIDPERLSDKLNDSDYKQINDRIDFWCAEIIQGDNADSIAKAVEGLKGDYSKYSTGVYRMEFAGEASSKITATLQDVKRDDKLYQLKTVNLAIAVSQMPQLTIQSALDKMVIHPNPAVRYLGWKTYLEIRDSVMVKGEDATNDMLKVLSERTDNETTPLVVAAMYSTLSFSEKTPNNVSASLYRDAQRKALDILQKSLNAQCILYADGYLDASTTCNKALDALRTFARINRGQNDVEDKILQSLVNVAYASAKAYQKTEGANEDTQTLLLQAEDALSDVSRQNRSFIQDVLVKKIPTPEKLPAVELAVVRWIKELQDRGVSAPDFAAPSGNG